jgi:hypothetical protein
VLQIKELKERLKQFQLELKNANDHIYFLSKLHQVEPKNFGLYLIKELYGTRNG